jgi:L-aminopeptidase/D-esterase-like protein
LADCRRWTAGGRRATLTGTVSAIYQTSGSICDVPGLSVGHATDERGVTGCTVVLCPTRGAVAGVDVRGAAPGTRETDLLRPEATVERVHAILLTGGSAYGLDAAGGVMRFLEEQGVGFAMRAAVVPIVPAAVIFDLGIGDARARPNAAMGEAACRAASTAPPAQGSVGAGTGATVGKTAGREHATKGGIGTASMRLPGGGVVGALVVVNAVGDVVDEGGRVLAGARGPDGWLADRRASMAVGEHTTIGIVATDLPLDKAGATRLAQAAHDGLALAVRPAHTAFDGDTFFALATGEGSRVWPVPVEATSAAAQVVALAIRRAVVQATSLGVVLARRDVRYAGREATD